MLLPPWAEGPFELILHGELHFRAAADFDRRMALISFDNAIEVAISSYLQLKPVHRQNRDYLPEDVKKWKRNYHTKLEFWELECKTRKIEILVDNTHIM